MIRRGLRRVLIWLGVGAPALALLYACYAELGGAPAERVGRVRGCLLCHDWGGGAELPPYVQRLKPGEPLRPLLRARVEQAHPLLSRGVEDEAAALMAARLLPDIAEARAGSPGQTLYAAKCAACHGRDGAGLPGEYPPLRGSEWISAEPSRLPEIMAQGLKGEITVRGERWNKVMLSPGIQDAAQVQQLVDFLRRAFAP